MLPAFQDRAGGTIDPTLATGEAGGGGLPQMLRPEVSIARKLRREMSLPEVQLWQRLRGRVGRFRFRRQHPIGPYVVDFYCRSGED